MVAAESPGAGSRDATALPRLLALSSEAFSDRAPAAATCGLAGTSDAMHCRRLDAGLVGAPGSGGRLHWAGATTQPSPTGPPLLIRSPPAQAADDGPWWPKAAGGAHSAVWGGAVSLGCSHRQAVSPRRAATERRRFWCIYRSRTRGWTEVQGVIHFSGVFSA